MVAHRRALVGYAENCLREMMVDPLTLSREKAPYDASSAAGINCVIGSPDRLECRLVIRSDD